MNGYEMASMAGYYDASQPDPCEAYPVQPEGLRPAVCAADQRHAALEQRVAHLEHSSAELAVTLGGLLSDMGRVNKRLDALFESIPLRTLPATKAAELAESRARIDLLALRLDNLIEQVLALQAHVQLVEPTFNERTGTFRPAGVQP